MTEFYITIKLEKSKDLFMIFKDFKELLLGLNLPFFNDFNPEKIREEIKEKVIVAYDGNDNFSKIKFVDNYDGILIIEFIHENENTGIFRDKKYFEKIYQNILKKFKEEIIELDANWKLPMLDCGGSDFYYCKNYDYFFDKILQKEWGYDFSNEKIQNEIKELIKNYNFLQEDGSISHKVDLDKKPEQNKAIEFYNYLKENYSEYKKNE